MCTTGPNRGATIMLSSPSRKKAPPTVPPGRFWAKGGDGSNWHPVSAHLADVAAVAQCLLDGRSVLAARLARALGLGATLPDCVWQTVVYGAAMHDVGKVQHGFQTQGCVPLYAHISMRGHVRPLLRSVHEVPAVRTLCEPVWRRLGGPSAFTTVICHHGRPYLFRESERRPCDTYWRATADRDPLAEFARLDRLALARSGLPADSAPAIGWTPHALHLFAGLITLADWIGSSERYFKYDPNADDAPDTYWARAQNEATTACADVGLRARSIVVPLGIAALAQLFPRTFPRHEPTVLQREMAEMPLPDPGTRLLIESDTGSGKTEAALTLYARLRAADRVDGLFFALPTRATAAAMHTRVTAVIEQLYPESDRPAVEIATGGRQGRRHADPIAAEPHQYVEPDDPEPAVLERWTSRSTRHAMAAEVVVGTVDQALLAALATRHAHLRLAGVVRQLLVVDEVHAHDRYMAKALRKLAAFHTAVGGVIVFMSATLASQIRAELGDDSIDVTVPDFDTAVTRPYPSLSTRAPGGAAWGELKLPAAPERTRSIHWSRASDEDALRTAIAAAERSARVLLIRNTVRDARATLTRLRELDGERRVWRSEPGGAPRAYHARYTTADRRALDRAVFRDFGLDSTARGVILVSTQVAEQSLDLDFDLLVTDLCPIDVLLQRLGRVHRHRRAFRGGFEDRPSAIVIEPEDAFSDLVNAKRTQSTHGHGTVYADLRDLELTRRLIGDARPTITIPEQCRELVELVYHEERREALSKESQGWTGHTMARQGAEMGADTNAEVCAILFDRPYDDGRNVSRFGSLDEHGGVMEGRVRTRLGDDRVRVPLPGAVLNRVDPAGMRDDYVDIDSRVLAQAKVDVRTLGPDSITAWSASTDATECSLGPLLLRYDDGGWSWKQK